MTAKQQYTPLQDSHNPQEQKYIPLQDSHNSQEQKYIPLQDSHNSQKQRYLPFQGLLNTRELGGYPVSINGKQKQVKWGLIYRSGGPEYMSAADKALLEGRNIKTVVDFRSAEERSVVFNLSSLVKKVELPIEAGNLMGSILDTGKWLYNPSTEGAEAEMLQLYSILPVEGIPRYRELFSLLSQPNNTPLLFHCAAGKDRTGMASALILHALGASRETIMEDFLASTEYLRPYWKQYIDTRSCMLPYMTVKEEYLLTAFSVLENYGGIDNYLAKELMADINILQNQYIENIL
ncbi:MAG: tyrosine-protein phosphatase [Spirochaetaceae bacterium]|jgi:protein-tyrosine phosphatase|nr:tyrosine-protein phosphatase [Spirochaetaceae bacterium]